LCFSEFIQKFSSRIYWHIRESIVDLSVEVERVQILSLLIGLVAIVSFDLALMAILFREEFSDVQRILKVFQIVGESEKELSSCFEMQTRFLSNL